jgi:hypothetical protein
VAEIKTLPKSERAVDVGGIGMLPGQQFRIQGKMVRVTEEGVAEVKGLFGWKPLHPRR